MQQDLHQFYFTSFLAGWYLKKKNRRRRIACGGYTCHWLLVRIAGPDIVAAFGVLVNVAVVATIVDAIFAGAGICACACRTANHPVHTVLAYHGMAGSNGGNNCANVGGTVVGIENNDEVTRTSIGQSCFAIGDSSLVEDIVAD